MISSSGLVPPIVYPQPDPTHYPSADATTVTPSAESPLAVDVTLAPKDTQTLPDGTSLPLDTIVTPHQASVSYLPAGTPLVQDQWPAPVGPFARDAWVIDALADRSGIAALLPPTTPTPVYWVLEGVLPVSVADPDDPDAGLLAGWLRGDAPGVTPRTQECQAAVAPGPQTDTADEIWKAAMLAGMWAELVPAETALGQVAAGVLTIWACAADGTLLPVSGLLADFAGVDSPLLEEHPVVSACQNLLADLPVRFFVRFDVWDVDTTSPGDAKGGPLTLQPDRVDLIDADAGSPVPGSTWTWQDPYGIVQVPRQAIDGATFWLEATFPSSARIRLERGTQRFYPDPASSWTWSTAASATTDGKTPGIWTDFAGIQVGTQTEPVTFWVGTKVRLAWAYQQQPRNWYGKHNTTGTLTTRRVAAGHAVQLFRSGSAPADTFVTDDHGEVSGVSFDVGPEDDVTAGLLRQLVLDPVNGGTPTVLLAVDDPATPTASRLFVDDHFHSEKARNSGSFKISTGGEIGAAKGPAIVVIDADKTTDSGRNTADAAAFHALKYARFTNDAVTLLKGDSANLPQLHEFRLTYTTDTHAIAYTTETLADQGVAARSYTEMPSAGSWFTSPVVVHEYGHALVAWLGSVLDDQMHYDAYEDATRVIYDRNESESHYPKGKGSHNEGQITNSGVALSEGLAQVFQCLLGCYGRLSDGKTTGLVKRPRPPAPGREGWPQYTYAVWRHDASGDGPYVSLSADSGRWVEGVFAVALFQYITQAAGFPGFLVEKGDTASGSRSPQRLLDDWIATLSPGQRTSGPAQLKRMFAWLVTDPINGVHSDAPATWSGRWPAPPDPASKPYPAVYDYLLHLQANDPAKQNGVGPTAEESFLFFFEGCLVPWNLEPVDVHEPTPPSLASDPPGKDWPS